MTSLEDKGRSMPEKTTHRPDAAPEHRSCQAHVKVWDGDTLIAESDEGVTTAFPECNGDLLIPAEGVVMDRLFPARTADGGDHLALKFGGPVVARQRVHDGRRFVLFDPSTVRIELIDRRPAPEGFEPTINSFPRWGDIADLLRLLDLERQGPDRFVAAPMGRQRRNVVEATQMVGQAVVAASRSVAGQRAVSAHITVIRSASFDLPLIFDVAVQHKGRTFAMATVSVLQNDKLVASCVILLDSGAPDLVRRQIVMPETPGPEGSLAEDSGMSGRDTRLASRTPDGSGDGRPPDVHAWVRFRGAPQELCLRQALLVQFMGRHTIGAAIRPHSEFSLTQAHASLSTAVLATTITLHEDPDFSDWLLYANHSGQVGRGLAHIDGRVFERSGRLIASASTQGLLRRFDLDPGSIDRGRLM
jgi:acyl-CoA thioesterase